MNRTETLGLGIITILTLGFMGYVGIQKKNNTKSVYYICYTHPEKGDIFERVSDYKTMKDRVDGLINQFNLDANSIHIFDETSIKTLTLQKTFEQLNKEDPGRNEYVYSNGCYTVSWYDDALARGCVWIQNASGLFKIERIPVLEDPDRFRGSEYLIDIKAPKSTLHEADLLAKPDNTSQFIAIKTLLDLDDILNERYNLHVLTTDVRTAFLKELA